MTHDDKALVERLRDFVIAEDIDLAADRIEALSAENERLKWEMRLAENLLSDCQKHLYGEGIAPPENVIAGIRERLK